MSKITSPGIDFAYGEIPQGNRALIVIFSRLFHNVQNLAEQFSSYVRASTYDRSRGHQESSDLGRFFLISKVRIGRNKGNTQEGKIILWTSGSAGICQKSYSVSMSPSLTENFLPLNNPPNTHTLTSSLTVCVNDLTLSRVRSPSFPTKRSEGEGGLPGSLVALNSQILDRSNYLNNYCSLKIVKRSVLQILHSLNDLISTEPQNRELGYRKPPPLKKDRGTGNQNQQSKNRSRSSRSAHAFADVCALPTNWKLWRVALCTVMRCVRVC